MKCYLNNDSKIVDHDYHCIYRISYAMIFSVLVLYEKAISGESEGTFILFGPRSAGSVLFHYICVSSLTLHSDVNGVFS